MFSTNSLFVPASRGRNYRLRRLFARHLTLSFVLLLLSTLILTSVLAGDPNESRKPATEVEPNQRMNSIVGISSEQDGAQVVKTADARAEGRKVSNKPTEQHLAKAQSFDGDLRDLPHSRQLDEQPPEFITLESNPILYPGTRTATLESSADSQSSLSSLNAIAPAPIANFPGLDHATFGGNYPPNTNGDIGPTYFIQAIDGTIGIFTKSDGVRVAAFSFNTLMAQGNFGNPCDTSNKGDAIVIYDSFEDRWIISDFAFIFDGSLNVTNPPGSFQCIAASKTGDPVSGGWNFYSVNTTGGIGNNAKFGIWPDGLYMAVSMLTYGGGQAFLNPRVYAFNKAQMYAGAPTVQSVFFDAPSSDNHLLPSNARLQTGTPPQGSSNYFVSTWNFLDGIGVYKFHVDWNRLQASTFSAVAFSQASTSWPNANVPDAPSLGGNNLKVIEIRAMMQNQYSNIGGAESLWTTHTVRRANTSGFAAPRWYQANVTGGSVAATLVQAATWDPDASNVIFRFLPSLAVNRMGDMAIGYTTSSSSTKPAIKYAGRLAADPINTLSQTEQVLIQGTGTQLGNCGGIACNKWGAYSAMSLDPDGCTFWFTSEYYDTDGLDYLTRIGSFNFPGCTVVGDGGAVSGTVTESVSSTPINGATVALGSRTTTTNASGVYTFLSLPAGTYPTITASFAGYSSSTATGIAVADDTTTAQDFSLTAASTSGCLVDTSQSDFQTGALTNAELNTTPGDVKLANLSVETQDQISSPAGLSIAGNLTATGWSGQTFRAGITGKLTRITVGLGLNSGTSGTITVEIRNLSGITPGTTVLATGTIGPVTNIGTGALYTTTFATPADVVGGTSYSIVLRTSVGNTVYAVRGNNASGSTMANGQVFTTTTSGSLWSAGATDLWLRTFVTPPISYSPSGNLVILKDANPAAGLVTRWLTLSWNATTPASTSVQFQAAASNNIDGPFNFVGPDGTASTFFISGASLAQFNGFRYLEYKALLSTSDSTVTPALNDATVCFDNATPMITVAAPLSRQQGSDINSQIAVVSDSSQTANTLIVTSTPLTGTGVTISNVIVDVNGNVTADVAADCTATNSTFSLTVTNSGGAMASGTLTVNVTSTATPTITPDGPTTFCEGGSVTLTSSSASGNQWYLDGNPIGGATNQAFVATAAGDHTNIVTASGCSSSPSSATTVTVNPIPVTPTITPDGPTTFCTGASVTLTSSSASGNQWYLDGNPVGGATNQTYVATASGNYTDVVTTSGCPGSASSATTVTVNPIPATPTITPGGPTTFCEGGSVALTSSSASGNQWNLNGNLIGGATNQIYNATTAGNYTATVSASGCSSTSSAATSVTADAPPTLTYGNQTVGLNDSLSLNPATGPADNVGISAIVVQSSGTYTGTISVDNTTGVVAVSNAAPVGTHTITIRATDSCGATTDASFTLTVSNRPFLSLSNANYAVNEATGFVTITVNRTGDLSVPVTVDYATDDVGSSDVCSRLDSGLGSARCDFGLTLGTLEFVAGEAQQSFVIPISQDTFSEGPEMFTVDLFNLTGSDATFATPSSATITIEDASLPVPNASDDTSAFVRQHYRDFLNREADSAGLAFWTNQIDNCTPKPECTELKRVNTSAAFFLSIEFQTTGNQVRSFYVAALDRPATNNMPAFVEFERDTQAMQRGLIVDPNNNEWQTVLANNRNAFMRGFVARTEFVAMYPTTDTPAQYVDKLYLHAVITPTATERDNAISEFGSATSADDAGPRGRVMLGVTQNATFQQREINRSFVQMQYFSYLRRNPNDLPDGNFAGFDFWVAKLNAAGGNYIESDMVKAFITSGEYRHRFGQ